MGPAPGPPPPCGPLNVLCGLKCIMSAPKSPGRADAEDGVHVRAVEIDQTAGGVHQLGDIVQSARSNIPSVLGLVIMNTAVWSSSLAADRPDRRSPSGVLLIGHGVEAGHSGAGRIRAMGTVGGEHLRALSGRDRESRPRRPAARSFRPGRRRPAAARRRRDRRFRPGSACSRYSNSSRPWHAVLGLVGMQIGEARQRQPAVRSAWGCTSSCTNRADRNACRRTCSASRGS